MNLFFQFLFFQEQTVHRDPFFLFFSNIGEYIWLNNNVLGVTLLNLISTIKRCPMLSS